MRRRYRRRLRCGFSALIARGMPFSTIMPYGFFDNCRRRHAPRDAFDTIIFLPNLRQCGWAYTNAVKVFILICPTIVYGFRQNAGR